MSILLYLIQYIYCILSLFLNEPKNKIVLYISAISKSQELHLLWYNMKCVTTYFYKRSIVVRERRPTAHILQTERKMLVWYSPQQKSFHHSYSFLQSKCKKKTKNKKNIPTQILTHIRIVCQIHHKVIWFWHTVQPKAKPCVTILNQLLDDEIFIYICLLNVKCVRSVRIYPP